MVAGNSKAKTPSSLNLPPRPSHRAAQLKSNDPETLPFPILEIKNFLEKYGVVSEAEMEFYIEAQRPGKPKSYLIRYGVNDNYRHELYTLFKLTIYANQPVLIEYFDPKQNKTIHKDAIEEVRELVNNAYAVVTRMGLPLEATGKYLILNLNTKVVGLFPPSELVEILKLDMSTRKVLDYAGAGFGVEEMRDAVDLPIEWVNKLLD
jgi:hypothetical protein